MPQPDKKFTPEVVQLKTAYLMDVAKYMRMLADDIESGVHGDNPATIVLIDDPGDSPTMFGWGHIRSAEHGLCMLLLAQQASLEMIRRLGGEPPPTHPLQHA